jgi:hypothetical protein
LKIEEYKNLSLINLIVNFIGLGFTYISMSILGETGSSFGHLVVV